MSGNEVEFTGNLGYNGQESSLNYFTYQPDATSISNAELAVIFKLLSKKDPKTKEKALNDLLLYIKEEGEVDEKAVVCWTKLYPKIAIDNSKSVRSLAHQIQGALLKYLGGKRYGKYLKSSIPIWLMGANDQDKSVAAVAYGSLLENFQGDATKVDKTFEIFQEQIVNLVGTVVTIETTETLADARYTSESEMQIKYDRVLCASISLLLKVMDLNPSAAVNTILQAETIWSRLISSIKGETMNLSLFTAILALILSLFSKSKTSANTELDVKSLYKIVSKTVLKVKFNKNVQPVIYSSVIIPFWQVLLQLTRFGFQHDLKKNIWDMGGGKSLARFHDYLELGACDSAPAYFNLVASLMTEIKNCRLSVLDFSNLSECEICTKSLVNQFERLRDSFKPSCLGASFKIVQLFDVDRMPFLVDIVKKALTAFAKTRLQTIREEIKKQLIDNQSMIEFKDVFSEIDEMIKGDISSPLHNNSAKFIDGYFEILQSLGLRDNLNSLVDFSISEYENQRVGASVPVHFVSAYIDRENALTSKVEQFIFRLPNIIAEQDMTERSIQLLQMVKTKEILEENDLADIINESFAKLELNGPNFRDDFIRGMNIDIDESLYPEIYTYMNEKFTGNVHAEDIEKFLQAGDKTILLKLIKNLDPSSFGMFIDCVSKLNKLDLVIDLGIEDVIQSAWSNVNGSKSFLEALKSYEKIYLDSMLQYLLSCTLESSLDDLVIFVRDGKLPYEALVTTIRTSINNLSPFEIAISNSLASSMYICDYKQDSFDPKVLILAKFLVLLNKEEPNWQALSVIACEYVSDFMIAQFVDPSEEIILFDILAKKPSISFSIDTIIVSMTKEEQNDPIVELTKGNDLYAFFAARSLAKSIEVACESASQSQFESLKINFQQLSKTPLKFVAFVTGISKFCASPSLDRIRNYIFSEILAVKKEEDILSSGLKWITMLIPFLDFDTETETNTDTGLFPIVKLTMVLNQIQNWLDSSIAYDSEFIDLRIQAVRFLSLLPSKQSQLPDVYNELVNRLIEENFEMAADRIDLKFYTLKSYSALLKKTNVDLENQNQKLLEIFTQYEYTNTQACIMVERILERTMLQSRFSNGELNAQKEEFFKILSKSKSEIGIRLSAYYLSQVLENEKNDFVIDFQLSKEEDKKAVLPPQLIQIVNEFNVSDKLEILRYLLSWFLITNFFKNVTIMMRNNYLNELVTTKNFQTLLYFIFEHIEMSNKFFDSLTEEEISSYDVIKTHNFHDLEGETKLLALYIYFQCLQYAAFQVQLWFREIRDRQLQMKAEKITTKYLSPPLRKEILEQVSKEKDKLQGKEDNLSIKVISIANEIRTMYVVDDQRLEMVIKIPQSYPLENVIIDGPSRVGVKENRWKAWLLASQKIISISNGTVVDAIELFCKNINLHFSGFEDCAICYSILHQDLSLPSKTCQTCNNKFHAACLYKWFKSSGNSTCPLCRTAFNFKYRS
ncbi:hypothetical protein KGF56_002764 [Candida oxycetoniae]|uniref:E3 ubiquitin-protein ligase listerin n=1 Tax=Candida oxycetoniae TaxID=497107 RepID=A0AAI9WXP8_9ASCO|nr:uncharacterized protein KGF56_002764 [Candida oxycetoniae]KAI3404467.2 hypothetical protein KGF56_002764 [Candida oxycetoniae]